VAPVAVDAAAPPEVEDAEADGIDAAASDAREDAPRALRVEVGAPEITGAPIADAERQLVLMKPAFRTCYDLWGRSSDVLTMQVSVTIDAKGRVDATGIKAKERLPGDLRDCIQSVVKRTRFSTSDGGAPRLSFSLAYTRSG
jgi:hypothetical protein